MQESARMVRRRRVRSVPIFMPVASNQQCETHACEATSVLASESSAIKTTPIEDRIMT